MRGRLINKRKFFQSKYFLYRIYGRPQTRFSLYKTLKNNKYKSIELSYNFKILSRITSSYYTESDFLRDAKDILSTQISEEELNRKNPEILCELEK